jgi:hypothetical protein
MLLLFDRYRNSNGLLNVPTPGSIKIPISGQEPKSSCDPVVMEVNEPKPAELELDESAWSQLKEEVENALKPVAKLRSRINMGSFVVQAIVFFVAPASYFVFVRGAGVESLGFFIAWFVLIVGSVFGMFLLHGQYNTKLNKVLPVLASSLSSTHGVMFRGTYDLQEQQNEDHGLNEGRRVAYIEFVPPTTAGMPMVQVAAMPAMPGGAMPIVRTLSCCPTDSCSSGTAPRDGPGRAVEMSSTRL